MTAQRAEQGVASHTAGPWTSDEPGKRFRHDNSAGIKGPDGIYVATALDFNRTDRDAEVEANARLIAAAPDGLAAARFALSVLLANPVELSERMAIERLEAFIAKAEGR